MAPLEKEKWRDIPVIDDMLDWIPTMSMPSRRVPMRSAMVKKWLLIIVDAQEVLDESSDKWASDRLGTLIVMGYVEESLVSTGFG